MGLAVNPCVAPAAGVVSKPMLAADVLSIPNVTNISFHQSCLRRIIGQLREVWGGWGSLFLGFGLCSGLVRPTNVLTLVGWVILLGIWWIDIFRWWTHDYWRLKNGCCWLNCKYEWPKWPTNPFIIKKCTNGLKKYAIMVEKYLIVVEKNGFMAKKNAIDFKEFVLVIWKYLLLFKKIINCNRKIGFYVWKSNIRLKKSSVVVEKVGLVGNKWGLGGWKLNIPFMELVSRLVFPLITLILT